MVTCVDLSRNVVVATVRLKEACYGEPVWIGRAHLRTVRRVLGNQVLAGAGGRTIRHSVSERKEREQQ